MVEDEEVRITVPLHPSDKIMTAVVDLAIDIYGRGAESTEHVGFFFLAWKYALTPELMREPKE